MTELILALANIVELEVDAITTAANAALSGGGGVDHAVHAAAGPALLRECRSLRACPIGSAVATGAYNLPARWVVHAVGPVWSGGGKDERALLASTYQAVLQLAAELGVRTLSLPAISCGAYRFPIDEAAKIAVDEVERFVSTNDQLQAVTFCVLEGKTKRAYERVLRS